MRKHPYIFLSGLVITILTVTIFYISIDYYTTAIDFKPYSVTKQHDDTMRIGFIGDSWAFYHKRHICKIDSIISDKTKRPVKIMSEGGCGATSKFVYLRLGADGDIRHIINQGPDYCIISAGINDTHLKLGAKFYQYHMNLIISLLISNHIKPIVIDIPDYDITGIYNELPFYKRCLRQFSMMITGSNMDCRDDFRNKLQELAEQREGKILLLSHRSWHSDALNDVDHLYRNDRIHLNNKGYEVLDSCISKLIISDINKCNSLKK
ncbi:MAG: SGNH/GDSL hydrolase family protein [Prevotella sp.]|nr:SGNH/GDSL hydrolase family protein [Prevotella sp.]